MKRSAAAGRHTVLPLTALHNALATDVAIGLLCGLIPMTQIHTIAMQLNVFPKNTSVWQLLFGAWRIFGGAFSHQSTPTTCTYTGRTCAGDDNTRYTYVPDE